MQTHLHMRVLSTLIIIQASCSTELKGPAPRVDEPLLNQELPVQPGILCKMQHPADGTPVTVLGSGFVPVPFDVPDDPKVALPAITLSRNRTLTGGTADLVDILYGGAPGMANADLLSWTSREEMGFAVVDELEHTDGTSGNLPIGLYDVTVTNEAGGHTVTSHTAFAAVDRPRVNAVDSPIICVAQQAQTINLSGEAFLELDNEKAMVELGTDMFAVDDLGGCEPIAHPGLSAATCADATLTLGVNSLAEGLYDVVVHNPDPASCVSVPSEDGVQLRVAPPPTITQAVPSLVCVEDGSRAVTLHGTGFLQIDSTLPTVTLNSVAVSVDGLDDCTDVSVGNVIAESCTVAQITIAENAIAAGDTLVNLTNPAPAACSVSNDVVLTVPPALTVASATPASTCQVGTGTMDIVVAGTGFLTIDGTHFTATFDGTPVTPSNITDCTALSVDGHTVNSCNEFTLNIDPAAVSGVATVTVTNPAPSNCIEANGIFEVVVPPTISSIAPTVICEQSTEDIVINGTNFGQLATVLVGGTAPDAVSVNVAGTAITITVSDLAPGSYDIEVQNAPGCGDILASALTVDPLPLVFFVDPPVVYNGLTTDVTIFTAGLSATAGAVELIDDSGNVTPLTGIDSPAGFNRIIAPIPRDTTAGTYAVRVTSAIGCQSSLNGTLKVTDTLDVNIAAVDPAFASPTVATAVTITRDTVAGGSEFANVPRVYLSPSTGGAGADAMGLRAVILESPDQLSAIVPAGMAPGDYDLIVVNPDGTVGLLAAALTVTAVEPPFIGSVAPGSLDANTSGQLATIRGAHFGTVIEEMSVTLECRDFNTGAPTTVTPTVAIDTAAADNLDVTVDSTGVNAGSVCVVIVTNPDGSSYRYSALSFKEPAQNLNPWSFGVDMQVGRRGHALVAGRPTARSRFLYAIAGDDGDLTHAKTDVESVPVDPFGQMGVWGFQRHDLSAVNDAGTITAAPRAFFGSVQVGRFIYLTGGHDGTIATRTTLRAEILDPLAGPEINDLSAALGDGTVGLDAGLWLYRVAALYPDDDPYNPGGETLPGEVLNVQLPATPDKIILTLNWDAVSGASGYRIYRTPAINRTVAELEHLADVPGGSALTYEDDGTEPTDDSVVPFTRGALGVWHPVAPMGTARESHGMVAVPNPDNASQWFLYVAGGRDDSNGAGVPGATLSSAEYANVTVASDGSQTLSAWSPLTAALSNARAELCLLTVTSADTNVVNAGPLVYFSQGYTGTVLENDFEVGIIGAGGDITALTAVSAPSPTRAGGAGLSANGWLFVLGGSNRNPSSGNDTSSQVTANTGTLDNWDALGAGVMIYDRIYQAAAKESAFFFVSGGTWSYTDPGTGITTSGDAGTSVEQTIQ